MVSYSIAAALSCVLAGLVMLRQRQQRGHEPEASVALTYQRRPLLTSEERAFYDELQRVLGQSARIFPKVSLSELVDLPEELPDRRTMMRRLRARNVDFAVCNPSTLVPLLMVQVEDRDPRRRRRGTGGLVREVSVLAGLPLVRVYGREPARASELALKIRIALGGGPESGRAHAGRQAVPG